MTFASIYISFDLWVDIWFKFSLKSLLLPLIWLLNIIVAVLLVAVGGGGAFVIVAAFVVVAFVVLFHFFSTENVCFYCCIMNNNKPMNPSQNIRCATSFRACWYKIRYKIGGLWFLLNHSWGQALQEIPRRLSPDSSESSYCPTTAG